MTERARDVLRYIRSVEQSLVKLREPLEVAPFLQWCAQREERIRKEIDNYPAISGKREGGITPRFPAGEDPRARLIMELGWDPDNGARRLYRWTYEIAGVVERAIVEEALFSAGVGFEEIYPDLVEEAVVEERAFSPVFIAKHAPKMTDEQVLAAYTVYTRGRMTMADLAELIWERYGYKNAKTATKSLVTSFQRLGLPARRCTQLTKSGTPCRCPPPSGSDVCVEHSGAAVRPSHNAARKLTEWTRSRAWVLDDELAETARVMHVEHGVPFRQIARVLLAQTPLRSYEYLAARLRERALREGWHQTSNLGRPRVRPLPEMQEAA